MKLIELRESTETELILKILNKKFISKFNTNQETLETWLKYDDGTPMVKALISDKAPAALDAYCRIWLLRSLYILSYVESSICMNTSRNQANLMLFTMQLSIDPDSRHFNDLVFGETAVRRYIHSWHPMNVPVATVVNITFAQFLPHREDLLDESEMDYVLLGSNRICDAQIVNTSTTDTLFKDVY